MPTAVLCRSVCALAVVSALASCGTVGATTQPRSSTQATGQPASGTVRSRGLSVSPASGGPSTVFALRFVAPIASGVSDRSRIGYQLGVIGPARSGCIASRSMGLHAAAKGQAVTVRLDPAALGQRWCDGTYTARVEALQTPACTPGQMCPQLLRVIGIVGEVHFQVRAPG